MQSTFYVVSAVLLLYIGAIETTYYTFTYDDGNDSNENCCLVRLGENFCLAKPLTRSLLQVHKKCQRLGANEKDKNYLNRIVRRLNVEASHTVGDKVLLELKAPIDKNILQNDLICLSSENNNIKLDKCAVEVVAHQHNKHKRKDSSRSAEKATNGTSDQVVVETVPTEDVGVSLLELVEPVKVHEGHGLAVHEIYDLDLTNFKVENAKQRQCWSWYRSVTKQLCNNPKKYRNTCIDLTSEREKCLQYLFQRKADDDQQFYTKSLNTGSKLYCEDSNGNTQYLGYHQHAQICFLTNLQISVQYKFTDFVSLSDVKKNKDVLEFIAKSAKFTEEFESDCRDKTTLADIKLELEKEAESLKSPDVEEVESLKSANVEGAECSKSTDVKPSETLKSAVVEEAESLNSVIVDEVGS